MGGLQRQLEEKVCQAAKRVKREGEEEEGKRRRYFGGGGGGRERRMLWAKRGLNSGDPAALIHNFCETRVLIRLSFRTATCGLLCPTRHLRL